MQVKSIAECSSILQYFLPSLSYQLSLKPLFYLFLSGCFTQVLLLFWVADLHRFYCISKSFLYIEACYKGTVLCITIFWHFQGSCHHLFRTDRCYCSIKYGEGILAELFVFCLSLARHFTHLAQGTSLAPLQPVNIINNIIA